MKTNMQRPRRASIQLKRATVTDDTKRIFTGIASTPSIDIALDVVEPRGI